MKKVNDIRTGRHCVFLLHAHLVFVTKYRYGVFTKIILDGLKEIFASVCRDFEAELIEFDGEEDHVHLLVVYPPKAAISSLVNRVNFHSKCKILGGVTEFFGKAFLCRFPPENLPRPVVYSVHSLPIQVTLGDS